MASNRQLAAILFTDIEGYTALMQQDERKAITMREQHRKILLKAHEQHNGRIVQFYGDGTLSIFHSAVDAVQCAVEMQQTFFRRPKIPVRMGLHVGDVIINGEEVMGDGVNFASRIESLGVKGSVLISDKVRDEIQNHQQFKTVSMGTYQLKNIERPVEVFALAHEGLHIPAPNTLQGKTEEKKPFVAQKPIKKLRLNQKSIAVLPFRAISNDSGIEWLSDGFTEELTSAIAGISDLRVKSSTTMLRYKHEQKSIEQISEELHVANFIEGTVQREGNNILINARLINPKTGEIRRPFKFRKDLSEIQLIYSQVAQEVAENLNIILNNKEKQKLQQTGKVNPQAYQLALQALYLCKKFTHKDIAEAVQLFNQALEIEPDYALALTGIAYCHVIIGIWNPALAPEEALNKSLPLLEKSLKIDPNLAFTHSTLGWARMFFQYDLENAEKEYIKAYEEDPSDEQNIFALLLLHLFEGNIDRAEYWCMKGQEVAPQSIWVDYGYAMTLSFQQHIPEAIQFLDSCIPRHDHMVFSETLAWLYILTQRYDAAIDVLEKGLSKFAIRPPATLSWLATAYFLKGNKDQSTALFAELENNIAAGKPNHSFYTAAAYLFIGNKEKALQYLQIAYERHDTSLLWLKQDPHFKLLRNEPRYDAIIEKIGF